MFYHPDRALKKGTVYLPACLSPGTGRFSEGASLRYGKCRTQNVRKGNKRGGTSREDPLKVKQKENEQ